MPDQSALSFDRVVSASLESGAMSDYTNRLRKQWRVFARNRAGVAGLAMVVFFVVIAIVGPSIAPYDPIEQSLRDQLQGPSWEHWLGTDDLGRDILSRILVGARISLLVGVVATAIGAGAGVFTGLLAGFFRRLDNPIMRVMDILLAFPTILLAVSITAILGTGIENVMIAVGISSIPTYARLMRSTVLSLRTAEFVQAATVVGLGNGRLLMRHVLPNAISPIVVVSSLQFGGAILTASILSFLGLGIQPPDPEWGQMVNAGRGWLQQAPYIATFPGLAIFLVVMGFNLLGDGLRDYSDPRMRNR